MVINYLQQELHNCIFYKIYTLLHCICILCYLSVISFFILIIITLNIDYYYNLLRTSKATKKKLFRVTLANLIGSVGREDFFLPFCHSKIMARTGVRDRNPDFSFFFYCKHVTVDRIRKVS